jgi:RNA polymerase sigma-70 factor (ECF subfamily)
MSGAIQGLPVRQIGQGLAAPRDKVASDPETPAKPPPKTGGNFAAETPAFAAPAVEPRGEPPAAVAAVGAVAPVAAVDPGWEALARVAAGDADAFGSLVEAHQERLLRLCERMLGDAEEARDAAQEVFLKAYRKAGDFRPQGQVYTLLYRIATNHCLNKLRRRRLVRFIQWEDPGEREAAPFDPPDAGPDPEATLESRRRWQRTRKAIARLPSGQRAVLVLARFEGLSYRQIAEVLGITEGAVESRLFRAMRRIAAVAAQD